MHSCRRKGYWVSARIWGDCVECFHNRPSIPNPSTESYSNGKTRVLFLRHKPLCIESLGKSLSFFGEISIAHALVFIVFIQHSMCFPLPRRLHSSFVQPWLDDILPLA